MSKKLTKTEREILYLYKVEFLTAEQIATRRGIKVRGVYKHLANLKKKGALNLDNNSTALFWGGGASKVHFSSQDNDNKKVSQFWRLHKLDFMCVPYHFFPKYHKQLKALGGFGFSFRSWDIVLYSDRVQVRLKKDEDFRHEDKFKCLESAQESFMSALSHFEYKLGFKVLGKPKLNIRLVNSHLAFTNSDFSSAVKDNYFSVRNKDGRVWFVIDNSHGAREHEYIDPVNSVRDSEVLEPYLNDMLDNQPLSLSELQSVLSEVVRLHRDTASGLKVVVDLLKPKKEDVVKDEVNLKERVWYVG